MYNYLKKLFFQNVLVLLIFFVDFITPVTQIACDLMCTAYNSIIVSYCFLKNVFVGRSCFFIWKNKRCFTFKSNLNIKNLHMYLNKKTDFIMYNI